MRKLTFAILCGVAALAAPASAREPDLAAKVEAFGRINSAHVTNHFAGRSAARLSLQRDRQSPHLGVQAAAWQD